jgi:sporulation protein YlmC with PRC-barrel domain
MIPAMTALSRWLTVMVLLAASSLAAAQKAPGRSDLPDRTIYAAAGHAIGQVAGVVLDASERITHALIAHDVDAGSEVRLTAVPWKVVLASRRGDRIVLDEQKLGKSPVVTPDELGARTSTWRARSDRHWLAAAVLPARSGVPAPGS